MMKWKVCGMRDVQNCEEVAQFNPDFMGFIWAKKSPRNVGEDFVIPASIPHHIQKVGVFVDESVEKIIDLSKSAGFTWVQLHGEEGDLEIERLKKAGLKVIKAISVATKSDVDEVNRFTNLPDYFLFDTKKGAQVGGTGERFDWGILDAYSLDVPIILAGGLDEENLAEAIQLSKKYPIEVLDFNSKLEVSPGMKKVSRVSRVSEVLK
jgi:phosphoribosylanthranilate isomerase